MGRLLYNGADDLGCLSLLFGFFLKDAPPVVKNAVGIATIAGPAHRALE
jgi:hypothetical protein